jgi:hypothetical protein
VDFGTKIQGHGIITCYKAHLMACGFTQEKGIDYDETFFPMVKISILHTLLSSTTIYDFHNHQMDVKTTFLHAHLHEEIYMSQPKGYVDTKHTSKVCKLLKCTYGLK